VTLDSILRPSAGVLFGVYPGSSCDSATSDLTRLRNHETAINRTASTNGILNFVNAYHDWNDFTTSFGTGGEGTMAAEGRILLIHWTPRIFGTSTKFLWPDIAAGVYDNSYVIPTAQAMRDFGSKFFLAFHNEMNASSSDDTGTVSPYGTDAQYASAARHIHDVFVAQGATNVIWVFKPSGYTTQIPTRMNNLYPGDAYVDWIGYDPYSSGGQSAQYVIDTKYPMYNWATVTKSGSHIKPMMWAEWGAVESGTGTSKADYITSIASLLRSYPLVKAICWYNSTSGTGDCYDTSTASRDAYKTLAADPFFNPDRSPTSPPVNAGSFRDGASKAFSNSANQTLTIPSSLQAGDGMLLFHGCTRVGLKNAAEGTNLANVTTGNSNTVGSNPWDSIGSPIPVYSSTQAHAGTTSIHYSLAAQTTARTSWETSFGSPSTYYGRLYYYRTALPPQITRLMQQNPASGSTPSTHWGIGLDTAGKVIVRDVAGASTKWTSTITPAANVWNRVEWKAVWNGSTTTVDVRIYENVGASETTLDDSTPTPSTATVTQAAAGTSYNFGLASPSQTYDIYLDDMGLATDTWMGPARISPALTPPTGWTEVVPTGIQQAAAGAGELLVRCFRRTVAAGDPGSTITLNTDVNAHGGIELVAYSGADQLALVDVAAASTKSSDSATVVTPNATTLGTADLIVSAVFTRDNPGGLTSAWTLPVTSPVQQQRAVAFPTGTADGRVSSVISDDAATHAASTYGTLTFTSDKTSYLGVGMTVGLLSTAAASTGQRCGFLYEPA
jgi:hypothetical protein